MSGRDDGERERHARRARERGERMREMAEESPNRFRDLTNAILEAIDRRVNGEPIPQNPQPVPREEPEETPMAESPIDQLNKMIQGAINERVKGVEPRADDDLVGLDEETKEWLKGLSDRFDSSVMEIQPKGEGFRDIWTGGDYRHHNHTAATQELVDAIDKAIEDRIKGVEPQDVRGWVMPNARSGVGCGSLTVDGHAITFIYQKLENGETGKAIPLFVDGDVVPEPPVLDGLNKLSDFKDAFLGTDDSLKGEGALKEEVVGTETAIIANVIDETIGEKAWLISDDAMAAIARRTRDDRIINHLLDSQRTSAYVTDGVDALTWMPGKDSDLTLNGIMMAFANRNGELESGLINLSAEAREIGMDPLDLKDEIVSFVIVNNERLGSVAECCEQFFNAPRPENVEQAQAGCYWLTVPSAEQGAVQGKTHTLVDGEGRDSAIVKTTERADGTCTVSVTMPGIRYGTVEMQSKDLNHLHKLVEDMATVRPKEREDMFQEKMSEIWDRADVPAEDMPGSETPRTPVHDFELA